MFFLLSFTQERKTFEQSAFEYFATVVYLKEYPKKPKIRFKSSLDLQYSRFVNVCFEDYLIIVRDSLATATLVSDVFRTETERIDSPIYFQNKNFCLTNDSDISKYNKRNYFLEVRRADSVKKDFCFVEIIIRVPTGKDHFYFELNTEREVIRGVKLAKPHN